MLNVFIVEDEAPALALLQTYIGRIPFLSMIGASRNSLEAFAYLQENEVDVLFLDINLPDLSGMELYKSLSQPPAVIFTTAYPKYAVEGFELEGVDYLLKPISFPRFMKACDRVVKRQKQNLSHAVIENSPILDMVYIKSGTLTHKLSWKEVLFLEKAENYVIYHTLEKRILSRQTLTDLEAIFPDYICRVHKSYAVSLLHVKQIGRDALLVNGQQIPIGRTFRAGLKNSMEKLSKFLP